MTKLRDKRLFLLDMDGTLYIGDRLFDGVPEFLRHVRSMGGRYLFLTNNSSRGVEGYIEKLRRLGIESAPGDYLTSVDATIRYLKAALPGKTCYIFGTDSFLSQLDRAGIPVTRDREQAEVLLCGFDTELTFQKLEDACILLNRGVPFVATNPDWVCPTWYGSVPDCGSVCRMLTTATGREPVVIGKPQPEMALLAMERTGFSPEQTVLLGDQDAVDELVNTVYASLQTAGPDDPTLETVSTFLRNGGSLETTAKELSVHPNTVRYRLKRAAETTGWDAADAREAYVLRTAIALGRMHTA